MTASVDARAIEPTEGSLSLLDGAIPEPSDRLCGPIVARTQTFSAGEHAGLRRALRASRAGLVCDPAEVLRQGCGAVRAHRLNGDAQHVFRKEGARVVFGDVPATPDVPAQRPARDDIGDRPWYDEEAS